MAPRCFPNGPVKKGCCVLPRKSHGDPRSLRALARKSIAYALTLPKPKAKNPRKKS